MSRSRIPEDKINITLTARQWRAIAAVLKVARDITTEDLIRYHLLDQLYSELLKQGRIELTPLD